MHSILSRLNSVSAFALTVLAALTFALFLSTAFKDYRRDAKIRILESKVTKVPNYETNREICDLGTFKIDLDIDLNSVFNWNVRELFVYLVAQYATQKNTVNQVVVWDKIIMRGENARLNLRKQELKYYFWDDGTGLKGNPAVTLGLKYNIVPYAGTLPYMVAIGNYTVSFPEDYIHRQ